ncbi:MAG: PIN domain-containing protein [Candidatus Nanopelagicales bacterium]|nr:PIN domain-containing protein [Candidatus Nanopelagicales bacterium]
MGPVVLDTSVILGLLDPEDSHHPAALQLLEELRRDAAQVHIPASAFAETLVGAARIGQAEMDRVERFVDLLVDSIVPLDRVIAREAAAIRARHSSIRLPDALVIATARAIGARSIHTADKRWRRIDDRVEVLRG